MRNNRQHLLEEIMKVDFALLDLRLFLNTHPNCPQALSHFHNLTKESTDLKKDFETNFGPLCGKSDTDEHRYNWIDTPWPWQNERINENQGGRR